MVARPTGGAGAAPLSRTGSRWTASSPKGTDHPRGVSSKASVVLQPVRTPGRAVAYLPTAERLQELAVLSPAAFAQRKTAAAWTRGELEKRPQSVEWYGSDAPATGHGSCVGRRSPSMLPQPRRCVTVTDGAARNAAAELLPLAEAAAVLRTPVATLRYWRHLGVGPDGFRLGRRVVYRREDVNRWLAEQQQAQSLRRARTAGPTGRGAAWPGRPR